jgi:hypothetical protein
MLFTIFPKHKGRVSYNCNVSIKAILPKDDYYKLQGSQTNIIRSSVEDTKSKMFINPEFEVSGTDKVTRHSIKVDNKKINKRTLYMFQSAPELLDFRGELYEAIFLNVYFNKANLIHSFQDSLSNSCYLRQIEIGNHNLGRNIISSSLTNWADNYNNSIDFEKSRREQFQNNLHKRRQIDLERIVGAEEMIGELKKIRF